MNLQSDCASLFLSLVYYYFEFVSYFGFRYSDLMGSASSKVPLTVLNESLSLPLPPPVKFKVNDRPSSESHLVANATKKTLFRQGRSLPGLVLPKGSSCVQ